MHKLFLFVVVAVSIALAQGAPANQAAPSAQSVQTPATAPSPLAPSPKETPSADVPTNAPVITLHGLCPDKPVGTDTNSPDCQTVITRAEFEHLTATLSPNMSGSQKQSLASDYARMLVMASEARKRGMENDKHYQDLVSFLKMQLLAQELLRNMQAQSKPSEADVQKYYQENSSKYETLSAKRIFIPRGRPDEVHALAKPGAPKPAVPKQPTDAELQAEGDKIRARLVAGADFDKLQKEVYETAGYKTPPPPTSVPEWRRDSVTPAQAQLFELKQSEFSKVIMEPAGAYVYQVQSKKAIPLEQVRADIENALSNDKMRQQVEGIMGSIKPEVNQAYFRALAIEGASGSTPPQRQSPSLMPPPTTPKPAPKPQ